MNVTFNTIDDTVCDAYAELGAVCRRDVFTDCSETILEWAMQPGDTILFDFRTVQGAHGNLQNRRRCAFSMRWVGADGHYRERPGRTSPPYPGHDMSDGQRLREDWFPVLWPRQASKNE
jgi:ectoine hydroxylase-related dioxygenase (phytanoyl-CoA dioxygenase family)